VTSDIGVALSPTGFACETVKVCDSVAAVFRRGKVVPDVIHVVGSTQSRPFDTVEVSGPNRHEPGMSGSD
jgi:hypothetical protein